MQETIELLVRIVGVLTLCAVGLGFTTVIVWAACNELWHQLRGAYDLVLLHRVVRRLAKRRLLRSFEYED